MTKTPATSQPARIRVDVLMTAYNAGETIGRAVESILSQDYTHFRLIVVNDGSTDETGQILHALAKSDDRILIVTQTNEGIVSAANRGLAECKAEFVARLDADDLAFPNRLRLQIDLMDADPECVAVSGFVYHIDANGTRLGPVAGSFNISEIDPYAIPAREPYIMHPVVMLRREAVEAVGGYRHVDFAEDTDLYWRLLHLGKLQVVDAVIGEYRVHQGSVTSRSIMNGRISAINSQLAAVSEQRRRENRCDVHFAPSDILRWRNAEELQAILALVQDQLDSDEYERYRFAVAAKLLELNSYRPYSLEQSDCIALNEILMQNQTAIRTRASNVRRLWARACAKLIAEGFPGRARALYDPCIRLPTVLRLVIQLIEDVMPNRLMRLYRRVKAEARIGLP